MFKKSKLKKGIKKCVEEIELLESKRSRSQSAIVQAILEQRDPSADDVEFFNQYTSKIEDARERLHQLQIELDTLDIL